MTAAKTELLLVAAVARNGVIGAGGRLPWRLPHDLQHFRAVTQGRPVVMGRRTWESLPPRFRPLPGRRNLVVSRQPDWQADGAETHPSLESALAAVAGAPQACVIGGAELYVAALPRADGLMLTEIARDFPGDVHFPNFDADTFEAVAREPHRAPPPDDFDYTFVTYRRRDGTR